MVINTIKKYIDSIEYGHIKIKIQGGKPYLIEKKETEKIKEDKK